MKLIKKVLAVFWLSICMCINGSLMVLAEDDPNIAPEQEVSEEQEERTAEEEFIETEEAVLTEEDNKEVPSEEDTKEVISIEDEPEAEEEIIGESLESETIPEEPLQEELPAEEAETEEIILQEEIIEDVDEEIIETEEIETFDEEYSDFEFAENDNGYTITAYHGNAENLEIPGTYNGKSVTEIGARVFQNNQNLRTVSISTEYVNVGESAFEGCTNLETASISASAGGFDKAVFKDCVSLRSVGLPYDTGISSYMFYNCRSLVSVPINYYTGGPGDYAFAGCSSLKSTGSWHELTIFGEGAFKDCTSLADIHFPSEMYSLKPYVFAGCTSLEKLTIYDGLRQLGEGAFEGCTGLKTIYVDGFFSIDKNTFAGCDNLLVIEGMGKPSADKIKEGNEPLLNAIYFPNWVSYTAENRDGTYKNYQGNTVSHATGIAKVKDEMKWVLLEDGVFSEKTGAWSVTNDTYYSTGDADCYYVENGILTKYTGFTRDISSNEVVYVVNGWTHDVNGVFLNPEDNKLYCFSQGRLSIGLTLKENPADGEVYCFENGVQSDHTGVVGMKYVEHGKVTDYTGFSWYIGIDSPD